VLHRPPPASCFRCPKLALSPAALAAGSCFLPCMKTPGHSVRVLIDSSALTVSRVLAGPPARPGGPRGSRRPSRPARRGGGGGGGGGGRIRVARKTIYKDLKTHPELSFREVQEPGDSSRRSCAKARLKVNGGESRQTNRALWGVFKNGAGTDGAMCAAEHGWPAR